ncbi:MAG: hypothetical protein JXC32_21120, partial [Anaerolineae bacterium]|nr:hypothetical protein [Anaerolineae bacterium]
MHDQPRQVLREIVRSYGLAILKDPRRSRALMMDLCGEFRGEINLVEMALREGVADELQSALPVMPRGFVIARLAQRLQDVYYLPNDAAQWAVETCAAVLESALETEASGRVLSSGVMATVHVRPWLSDDQAWEAIGQTPGNVVLPDSGELRISARVDDAAATELARDLAAAGTVHRLDLSYSPLADEGLSRLLDLKGLVALDLSRTRIGDESLKRIGESETLREVNLWGVETLSDDGVVALGRCKRLESLELGRCSTITDRGLRGLRQLPHLAHLGLAATGITDSGLRWVGEIPALRSLDLSATGITGRGLDAVTGLGDLASLDLSGCVNLRPEGLVPLRSVAGLTELQL